MRRSFLAGGLLLLAGCCVPPANSSSGGRATTTTDSVFAFFGGLRCFFGDSEPRKEERPAEKTEETTKDVDHVASLTIR